MTVAPLLGDDAIYLAGAEGAAILALDTADGTLRTLVRSTSHTLKPWALAGGTLLVRAEQLDSLDEDELWGIALPDGEQLWDYPIKRDNSSWTAHRAPGGFVVIQLVPDPPRLRVTLLDTLDGAPLREAEGPERRERGDLAEHERAVDLTVPDRLLGGRAVIGRHRLVRSQGAHEEADDHRDPGSPGPHRGRKRSIYEGGVRQPLVVRWPGKIKAGVFDGTSVIGAVDFFPTVCALTGVAPPGNAELDGEDVSDILLGGQSRPRQKPLFWEWRSRVAGNPDYAPPPIAVRDGPWKLLTDADRSRVELYDIPNDPAETNNLAATNPDVVEPLAKLALDWKATLPPGEEQPLPPRKAKPQGKPMPDRAAMFKAKDSDRDDTLTIQEYLRNFPDQAEGRRRFPTFDANGDGMLSKDEFITMGGRFKP